MTGWLYQKNRSFCLCKSMICGGNSNLANNSFPEKRKILTGTLGIANPKNVAQKDSFVQASKILLHTHPKNLHCQHPKLVNPLVPAYYEDVYIYIYTKTLPYNCLPRQAHIWPRGNTINTGALWLVRTPLSFNPNTRLAKQIEIAVAKYLRHWRLKNKRKYRHISTYTDIIQLSTCIWAVFICLYYIWHLPIYIYPLFHTSIWLKYSM